jgi:hypothetical protein
VPVPPSAIPLASVTNVKLTELDTVAVTATVPEAVAAEAGTLANAAKASRIPMLNNFLLLFIFSFHLSRFHVFALL